MPEPEPISTAADGSTRQPSAVTPRAATQPSTSQSTSELPYPEELQAMLGGAYVVESFLGQGGMGAVYRGLQMPFRRPVAIKILAKRAAGVDDEFGFEERFKREAYAMAALHHPNIVQVYDCGDAGDKYLFISMELVEGGDLSDAIKARTCTPEVALKLIPQICDALQTAHEKGIVHRDIKPANIFLTPDGKAKVADFGLAKRFDARSTLVTKTGLGMGTPDYAAPEQYENLPDIDHRADIYSLGVMIYQMLTGRLPRGMAQAPSTLVVGLDPGLDTIVQRAMQHDREQRYQSAREVRQALDVITSGSSAQASKGKSRSPAAPKQAPHIQLPVLTEKSAPATLAPRGKSRAGMIAVFLTLIAMAAIGGWFLLKDKRVISSPPEAAMTSDLSTTTTTPAVVQPPDPATPVLAPTESTKPVTPPVPAQAVVKVESTPKMSVAPEAPKVAPTPAPPAVAPSPTPQRPMPQPAANDLDQRLATLKQAFDTAVERDAGATYKTNIAALDKSYIGALDRALAVASSGGKLEEALALREEKQRIANGEGVPPELDESTLAKPVPDSLKTLRKTYRSTAAQHEATKAKAMQPLYDRYDQALAAVQAELTKASQLDEAMRVKSMREQLAATRGSGEGSTGLPARTTLAGGAATQQMEAAKGGHALPATALFATKDKPFTNTLGMKFVPVPGTKILMCIHETRRSDYSSYAREVRGVDNTWKEPQFQGKPLALEKDHPVVAVSWDDAAAFCDWLSKKERRTYRLPDEHEWNLAVAYDIEDPEAISPADLEKLLGSQFPWDKQVPEKCGNYRGGEDGFEGTAPVMSFRPNQHGIHDLGGNAWEWCRDGFSPSQKERILRGCGFLNYGPFRVSKQRQFAPADFRVSLPKNDALLAPGFRCVLETGSSSSPGSTAAEKPPTPTPTPLVAPPASQTSAAPTLPLWLQKAAEEGGILRIAGIFAGHPIDEKNALKDFAARDFTQVVAGRQGLILGVRKRGDGQAMMLDKTDLAPELRDYDDVAALDRMNGSWLVAGQFFNRNMPWGPKYKVGKNPLFSGYPGNHLIRLESGEWLALGLNWNRPGNDKIQPAMKAICDQLRADDAKLVSSDEGTILWISKANRLRYFTVNNGTGATTDKTPNDQPSEPIVDLMKGPFGSFGAWVARGLSGNVYAEKLGGFAAPVAELSPALAVRSAGDGDKGTVVVRKPDGTWRAMGGLATVTAQVAAAGPALDLDLHVAGDKEAFVLWIESKSKLRPQ